LPPQHDVAYSNDSSYLRPFTATIIIMQYSGTLADMLLILILEGKPKDIF
jgi:hypothetical protein